MCRRLRVFLPFVCGCLVRFRRRDRPMGWCSNTFCDIKSSCSSKFLLTLFFCFCLRFPLFEFPVIFFTAPFLFVCCMSLWPCVLGVDMCSSSVILRKCVRQVDLFTHFFLPFSAPVLPRNFLESAAASLLLSAGGN